MTAWLYRVEGQWCVSLALETDVAYWREKGVDVTEGWRYRSVAQAMCEREALEKGKRRERGWMHVGFARGGVGGENVPVGLGAAMERGSLKKSAELWREWRPLLGGRSLLLSEVRRVLAIRWKGDDLSQQRILRVLQVGVLKGEVFLRSAVRTIGGQANWRCERCHAGRSRLVQTACARCGGTCYYCDECLLLGRSRACEPLLQIPMPAREEENTVQEAAGRERASSRNGTQAGTMSLTPAQRRAAERALAFVRDGKEPVLLLWAVTGAGKTEMTFAAVSHVLNRQGRVAVATPRKDVVNELTPRFRHAFPAVRIVKLHGESGETWLDGELVIATTHQLLRWYRTFDLIVVDEVDAFPYRHNESLQAGVRRALKETGQQLWLTATPPRSWQTAFRQGKLPGVTIPVRHHGHPLPEPYITLERRLWEKVLKKRQITALDQFLAHVQRVGGQAYLFVPSLSHVTPVLHWLSAHAPELRAAGVSSRDREREKKVQDFRDGEYDCLVTTTVLERGVTVSNAHVAILQADHPIWDEAALVQMSGRCGRSSSFPSGHVFWIAQEASREQSRALKHIRRMNREAWENGWLKAKDGR